MINDFAEIRMNRKLVVTCVFAVALTLLFFVAGCAKKNIFVLLPNPDGTVGEITVTTSKGTQVVSHADHATEVSSADALPSKPVKMDEATIKENFGKALEAQPAPPVTFRLYFKSGTNRLTEDSERLIPDILAAITSRNSTDISVVGHADRVGREDANRRLSYNRAVAVRDILTSRGVDPGFVEVTSHGESNPVIPTADEVAEPKNRRVEVIVR